MTVMWFLKSICNKKDILSYIYPRKWSHEFDFLTLIHTCNKNGTFKREQGRKKHEKTSKGRKKQQTNKQVWGSRAFTASNGMRTRQKLSYWYITFKQYKTVRFTPCPLMINPYFQNNLFLEEKFGTFQFLTTLENVKPLTRNLCTD